MTTTDILAKMDASLDIARQLAPLLIKSKTHIVHDTTLKTQMDLRCALRAAALQNGGAVCESLTLTRAGYTTGAILLDAALMEPGLVANLSRLVFDVSQSEEEFDKSALQELPAILACPAFKNLRDVVLVGDLEHPKHVSFLADPRVTCSNGTVSILPADLELLVAANRTELPSLNLIIFGITAVDVACLQRIAASGFRTKHMNINRFTSNMPMSTRIDEYGDEVVVKKVSLSEADVSAAAIAIATLLSEGGAFSFTGYSFFNKHEPLNTLISKTLLEVVRSGAAKRVHVAYANDAGVVDLAAVMEASDRTLDSLSMGLSDKLMTAKGIEAMSALSARVKKMSLMTFGKEGGVYTIGDVFAAIGPVSDLKLDVTSFTKFYDYLASSMAGESSIKTLTLSIMDDTDKAWWNKEGEAFGPLFINTFPNVEELTVTLRSSSFDEKHPMKRYRRMRRLSKILLDAVPATTPLRTFVTPYVCLVGDSYELDVQAFVAARAAGTAPALTYPSSVIPS